MDPRVKDIIEKVKVTAESAAAAAGKAAESASRKAGGIMETTKLNMKIFDLNTDIDLIFKQIGKTVYLAHTGVETDPEEISDKLDTIDEKYSEINEIKAQLAIKKTVAKCSNCGKECDRSDAFCSACGTTL